MRSEQQHIDDFIRNKTDEFYPDQQGLQPNWQQMQKMLGKPGPKFKITKASKLIKYVGGIAVVTIITITAIQFNNKKKPVTTKKAETKSALVTSKPVTEPKINTVQKAASNQKNDAVAIIKPGKENKVQQPTKAQKPSKSSITRSVIKSPIKKTYNDQISKASGTVTPKKQKTNEPDPLLILEQFYAELKKTPEEFIIHGDRDTILNAKEGTKLKIPAQAFGKKTGQIKIILTEFYSDEDMITGKLSTTTNGQQLVTGGMLNIQAEADGVPVQIAPDKAISVDMPTKNYDEKMQLYTGNINSRKEYLELYDRENENRQLDVRSQTTAEMINWIPAGQDQGLSDVYSPRIFKVPDIAGEPHKVHYGKNKITTTFLISRDLKMSNKEVKEKLRRYSLYYDEIKVRRLLFGPNFLRFNGEPSVIKGDSIVMKFESALRLKLVSKEDSIRFRQLLYKDSVNRENKRKYLSNYRFEVRALGWINCDKLLEPGPRTEFTINLGEGIDAGNFVSQIVFDRYKSIMPGFYSGSKIKFRSIPVGEPVHVITVGVINGKVFSCIKPLDVTNQEVDGLPLQETSSEEFRKKVKELVKIVSQ